MRLLVATKCDAKQTFYGLVVIPTDNIASVEELMQEKLTLIHLKTGQSYTVADGIGEIHGKLEEGSK